MRISNGRGWSKSGTLPTGNDFLPDTDTQILLKMIAACPPGKVRDILRACYERKINASIRRIRDLLMRPYSTVREWLWRVHERGLDNISDRKPPGARGILGPEEIEIVRETLRQPPTEHGFEQGAWLLRMIAEVITKKLKKHCRPRTIRRLLRRMGFSYVKPRTVPHKSASKMEQEEFMQQCKQLVSEKSAEDYTMLAQDEAGVQLGACGGYGWRFKADGCEVGVGFSTKETRIIGAVGPDAVHVKVVKSINADTFIEFLKEMRQIYKKFVMFLDNLSAHKAVKVSEYVKSAGGDIVLMYLPKYTPQLNPMEIQWNAFKNMLAQRCFNNAEELAKSIRILVDTGQLLPVKQMDYMIP